MTPPDGAVRRPLVGVALVTVAGTGAGLALPSFFLHVWAASCAAAALAVLLMLMRRAGRASPLSGTLGIHASVLLAAWAVASAPSPWGKNATVDVLAPYAGERVRVEGVVRDDPDRMPLADGKRQVAAFSLAIEVPVSPASSRRERLCVPVRLYADAGARTPRYGELWDFVGEAEPDPRSRAGTARLAVRHRGARLVSEGHGAPLLAACYAARHWGAQRLALGIEEFSGTVAVVRALLLGYRAELPLPTFRVFAVAGTVHVLAISGLHVGIVTLLIVAVLRIFRVSRVYWFLFIAPLLVAYTAATGARPSAIRACVVALLYFLAPLVGRRPDPVSALAAAALAILVVSPGQLFDVGFILSFGVVIGLICLYPVFDTPLRRLCEPDPFRMEPEGVAVRMGRRCCGYFVALFAVSCSAWLVSAPLTAWFFGHFTPVALLSNLLVIPVAFLVLLNSCLSLVLGSCLDWFAVTFNHANVALVGALVAMMRAIARLPFSSVEVARPPLWGVAAWYGLLLGARALVWGKVVDSRGTP